MKLKITLILIAIYACVPSFAQEITIQELLDRESKRVMKKINEDLEKDKADLKISALPKLNLSTKLVPKSPEPFAIAVFGISPNYSGYMNFNGSVVHVIKGNEIHGRVVIDINKYGITLLTPTKKKAPKFKKLPIKKAKKIVSNNGLTKFYPVVSH